MEITTFTVTWAWKSSEIAQIAQFALIRIQRAYKATPERWVRICTIFSVAMSSSIILKITLIIVYSVFQYRGSCQRRMIHVAVIMKRRHAATRNQLGPESAPLVYR